MELHEQLGDYWGCGDGETYRYQILDATGDGAPDFVVTDSCDAEGAGTTRWEVYKNTGSGFADSPLEWSLPQVVDGVELHEQLADYWGCGDGETYRYQILDLDGDGAPDFTVTDACDAGGAGTSRWDVYLAVCEE